MNKLSIITSRYPTPGSPYNHAFVRARAIEFAKISGTVVTVFVPHQRTVITLDEGVQVCFMPTNEIKLNLDYESAVYLHLLNLKLFSATETFSLLKSVFSRCAKIFIYFHGSEVQSYSRYLFDFKISLREVAKLAYKNLLYMPIMRHLVRSHLHKIVAAAPSLWMLSEAEDQLRVTFCNTHVVPNGIRDVFFNRINKSARFKDRIVLVRPLNSKKYAVDIALRIMTYVPASFTLDIYGKGHLEERLKLKAVELGIDDRVKFHAHFIEPTDLPSLFKKYHYALMPTRMDAQGVTMCEMIAAGCRVISSKNTAIPEFVFGSLGLLINNDDVKGASDQIFEFFASEVKARKSDTDRFKFKVEASRCITAEYKMIFGA